MSVGNIFFIATRTRFLSVGTASKIFARMNVEEAQSIAVVFRHSLLLGVSCAQWDYIDLFVYSTCVWVCVYMCTVASLILSHRPETDLWKSKTPISPNRSLFGLVISSPLSHSLSFSDWFIHTQPFSLNLITA